MKATMSFKLCLATVLLLQICETATGMINFCRHHKIHHYDNNSGSTITVITSKGVGILISISPSGVAPACSGDQLELTCTTPGSFAEWSFFVIPEGETTARRFARVLHTGYARATSDIEVNSITFTFSRISDEGSLPLILRLIIDPVSDGLNGTEVNCTDVLTSNSTSTRIKVINESSLISGSKLMNNYYAWSCNDDP